MATDSSCFCGNGNKSFSFYFANLGYDIWLGNFRGTEFSRHKILQRSDKKFWDFSYHENGLYDLSANFKYISAKTKSKIFYIGHSMGGSAMAIYLSMKPEEAMEYVKHTTFLSGSFHMKNTHGIFGFNYVNNMYDLLMLLPNTNMSVLLGLDSFERQFMLQFCLSSLKNAHLCIGIIDSIAGTEGYEMSPENILLALPCGKNQCLKQMLHYVQAIRTQEFRMFDYGPKENMIRYNSTIPPKYDLTKMSTDITFIYGAYDGLATKEDNIYTFNKYRKPNWDAYEIPYNHYNYLFDRKYVDKILYPLILKIINK
ncbi:unnamed protein product [Ceutorhynchus assimilis]|uniref:AB hydrolase-1 domain-containing protein n=1 Tax=Ceutorhynchus assimilis TaxID=467358 RepID=A0A9N9QK91_9CUCU|nr:unnamed protein product [Ceutorhynchus assimilis]